MHDNSMSKRRHDWLDLLRVIMCVGIVVLHCRPMFLTGGLIHDFLHRFAYFTDIFFVIAGFSAAKTVRKRSYLEFVSSRLVRVYPLYLATGLISVLLLMIKAVNSGHATIHLVDPILYVALLQSAGLTSNSYAINGPAWSLSAIFICYLLAPVIAKYSDIVGHHRWSFVAIVLLLCAAITQGNLSAASNYGIGVLRCLPSFVFGMAICDVKFHNPNLTVPYAAVISAVFIFLVPDLLLIDFCRMVYIWTFFLAVVWINERSVKMPNFAAQVAALSPYSFGIYLIHSPVISVLSKLFPYDYISVRPYLSLSLTILVIAIAYLLAKVSFVKFEEPIIARFKRNYRDAGRMPQRT